MGIVTNGIPEQIVLDLAKNAHADVFVETGTFRGDTTRWAASHFKQVHTIERAQCLFDEHNGELSALPGVTPHLGDSKDVLPKVVEELGDESAVFWLDGHWSGGFTAGADDECPIMEELECLASRDSDIILIDDARLFLCAPPQPHRPEQWPTMMDISHALAAFPSPRLMQVVLDVIFIVPDVPELSEKLIQFAQHSSNEQWSVFREQQRKTMKHRIKRMFGRKG